MSTDPRLADPLLLVLAATRRRARRQAPDWRHTEGLASLLDAARPLPQQGPWSLPAVEEGGGALAKLLAEARQWQKDHGHDQD